MIDQFDMFAAPPAVAMTIEEITIGDPGVKRGFIGKYHGIWVHITLPITVFNRQSDEEKQGMRERVRVHLESRV